MPNLLINYYWSLVAVSLILYLYQPHDKRDWIELSFYPLYFLVGTQVKHFLQKRVPYVFNELRQTGSLPDDLSQSVAAELQRRLNSVWGNVWGIAFGLAIILFHFNTLVAVIRSEASLISVLVDIIDVFLAYAVGVAIWKARVTGAKIRELASRRQLRIRPFHPDDCAGLGAIGRLCFSLSLILITVGLFLCGWIFYGRCIQHGYCANLNVESYPHFEPWFAGTFLVVTIFGVAAFFWPMLTVHRLMKEQATNFKAKLMALAQRISDLEESLLSQGSQLEHDQLQAHYAQVQFFRSAYTQRRKIPTWPIDLQTLTKFLGVQIPLVVAFFTSVLTLWEKGQAAVGIARKGIKYLLFTLK